MNLTEPDAGSDVGAVRTRATPLDDGRWAITGTKIFITWGDHDAAGNIVHLCPGPYARRTGGHQGHLAVRRPPQPHRPGRHRGRPQRGSLHRPRAQELGIHASPTCVLDFDGAIGELVGAEYGGMAAMLTMMNAARLSVGLEGLAVSERAYQQALTYARERRQGRTPTTLSDEFAPIIEHPDVRRMLLLMASGIDAIRMLYTAPPPPPTRLATTPTPRLEPRPPPGPTCSRRWPRPGAPTKGCASRPSPCRCTAMGYVEETGIAQRYRDARIAPIYEGTNGIQAIDLVARKVRRDGGAAMRTLIDEVAAAGVALDGRDDLKPAIDVLDRTLTALREATAWLLDASADDEWLAAATPYLDLASLAVCGGLLARQASWAIANRPADHAAAVLGRFAFFAVERLTGSPALLEAITAGSQRLSVSHLG